jgi:hypothetical protein
MKIAGSLPKCTGNGSATLQVSEVPYAYLELAFIAVGRTVSRIPYFQPYKIEQTTKWFEKGIFGTT